MRVIVATVYGGNLDEFGYGSSWQGEMAASLQRLEKYIGPFFSETLANLLRSRMERDVLTIFRQIKQHVESSPAAQKEYTLWRKLQEATDDEGGALTSTELDCNLIDLLMAGFETTATTALWCFVELSRNPDLQERLRAHIVERCGLTGDVDWDTMESLDLLNAFMLECSRLHATVVAFNRASVKDSELKTCPMPGGTTAWVSPAGVMNTYAMWGPHPDKFNPERFMGDDEAVRHRVKTARLGFGVGPHVCIGQHLAIMELKLILIETLRQLRVQVLEEESTLAAPKTVVVRSPISLIGVFHKVSSS